MWNHQYFTVHSYLRISFLPEQLKSQNRFISCYAYIPPTFYHWLTNEWERSKRKRDEGFFCFSFNVINFSIYFSQVVWIRKNMLELCIFVFLRIPLLSLYQNLVQMKSMSSWACQGPHLFSLKYVDVEGAQNSGELTMHGSLVRPEASTS